jgi:glutathione S-transferase
MTLKIYGVYHSRASRVIWLANELGLPFEHVPVMQRERVPDPEAPDAPLHTRKPEFMAINPNGMIPSIDDDGLVLHQSLAINLYLARKHGGPVAAQNAAEDALITMWTLWAATEVEPHSLQILLHLQANPPDERDPTIVATAIAALAPPFAVLDQHLAAEGHMVGGRFTVADINVAEVVRYATAAAGLFDAAPHVAKWLRSCQSRPAFIDMYTKRLAETA